MVATSTVGTKAPGTGPSTSGEAVRTPDVVASPLAQDLGAGLPTTNDNKERHGDGRGRDAGTGHTGAAGGSALAARPEAADGSAARDEGTATERRETRELLGALRLVNQEIPLLALKLMDDRLPVAKQVAFADVLEQAGRVLRQHAAQQPDVIDMANQAESYSALVTERQSREP